MSLIKLRKETRPHTSCLLQLLAMAAPSSFAFAASAVAVVVTHLVLLWAWKFIVANWFRPLQIRRFFEAQGIRCLPYRFFCGNIPEFSAMTLQARSAPMPRVSHDVLHRLAPHYSHWVKEYGSQFVHWIGPVARLNIADPELVKDILSTKSGHFSKLRARPDTRDLLGAGLVSLEGEKWAAHRRIVNPAFYMEKLKAMTPTIAACASSMVEKWQDQLAEDDTGRKEIDVHEEFRKLTADIIAHTAFGTSYVQGKRVFVLQREQQILLDKAFRSVYIPGFRFLPTATNRYRWRLEKEIRKCLKGIIQSRTDSTTFEHGNLCGNDLLGLMMASNNQELHRNLKNLTMDTEEIINECKIFFFAGHETTSNLLTWALMLLAQHKEWQERVRAEVLAVCGKNIPDGDMLPHLKIVGMVLNEALRLYPPVTAVLRQASKDMKISTLLIPKGTSIMIQILALHHDPKVWGPDANEFNPLRFINGVVKACKHPTGFLPFSVGPRNCVGQNFALLEAKIVLSMVLQHFDFHLSPTYRHAPTTLLTLQPQYGMQIILEKAK